MAKGHGRFLFQQLQFDTIRFKGHEVSLGSANGVMEKLILGRERESFFVWDRM